MHKGIKHIEIAVSNLENSLKFYDKFFEILGWGKVVNNGFVSDNTKIYLKKWNFPKGDTLGARHICFWAPERRIVDSVGEYVKNFGVVMIRGPLLAAEYSPTYYTVDFYDPDGYMLEVAYS